APAAPRAASACQRHPGRRHKGLRSSGTPPAPYLGNPGRSPPAERPASDSSSFEFHMRRLLIAAIFPFSPCAAEPETAENPFVVETCAPLPGAERAKPAETCVRPALERAFS